MRKLKLPGEYTPGRLQRRIKLPDVKLDRSQFWHLHAHSKFSSKDALSSVEDMVKAAWRNNQPALALTDHGNMAGAVQLYTHCKRAGIAPFPGIEAYLKQDKYDKDAKRYHVGLVAFTTEGYEALVKLTSLSHTREYGNFHHYPHIDFSDMAEWYERGWTRGIALTTGCYFGMVQQTLINQGAAAAEWLIGSLSGWFPHTYVELQHHDIDHGDGWSDSDIIEEMSVMAHNLGLPTVITQDAHYCHPEEKPVHETLKRLVSWADDPSEAVFPGDSFHLADEDFVRGHYASSIWYRGIEGLQDLLSKHSLVIPELESYHYNVPIVTVGDPLDELKQRTAAFLNAEHLSANQEYAERWEEEMEVVVATDMAGYLMLNAKVCDWMRSKGIFFQARGSASGSLLCMALGITQLDPIKEGLRYERFLSKDRTKPPDIDLDVEDERRGEVLDYLASHFNVCQIGTWAEYSVDEQTGRGSLLVDYLSRKRKEGADHAQLAQIKGLNDIPWSDRQELVALGKLKPYKSYGTHAGGVVITSSESEFNKLVPTMLVASSNTRVTQYDMDDVEALGLLKLDILGQKSLTMLRKTTELLGRDPKDGWDWIPLNDKETFRAVRQQMVDGVFQLEGWTNKKGCRELKPKTLRDIIHLVALYRPATIDNGMKDLYIERKAGWSKPPKRSPIVEKALRETYGVPVFQDQIIVILREIGFAPEDLTKLLKAVKASNENIGNAAQVIKGYEGDFYTLAGEAQLPMGDAKFVWEAVEGFAKYGFNKAHAAAYGRRAYWMAYLKTHHPLEFHTALLQTNAGSPKEKEYVLATKGMGISMLKPDVNISGATWSIDRNRGAIRKGLVSIKGVGEKAAREIEANAPYSNVDDVISKCDARMVTGGKSWVKDGTLNGVLGKLKDAGALKSLGV